MRSRTSPRTAATGITLLSPNSIGSFNATNGTSGDISLNNVAPLSVSGITQGSSGNVIVSSTGSNTALTINGCVTSSGGNVILQATGNLIVAANQTISSSSGTLTLAADVTASGNGDDGVGTLTVSAGATIVSSDSAANAVTLRGADVNIDTSSSPAIVGATEPSPVVPAVTLTGLSEPALMAFDSSGDLFVSNAGGGSSTTVSEFAPGSSTPTATLTGLSGPTGMVFDSSGDLYVANFGGGSGSTVSEFAAGSTTPMATLIGLAVPEFMAFDASGNLYVTNTYGTTVSEFAARKHDRDSDPHRCDSTSGPGFRFERQSLCSELQSQHRHDRERVRARKHHANCHPGGAGRSFCFGI